MSPKSSTDVASAADTPDSVVESSPSSDGGAQAANKVRDTAATETARRWDRSMSGTSQDVTCVVGRTGIPSPLSGT